MKNSEICRAAMPKIAHSEVESSRTGMYGMCNAICSVLKKLQHTKTILNIVLPEDENMFVYYYPTFFTTLCSLEKQKQGYTSRIIYLELAALLWEELEL